MQKSSFMGKMLEVDLSSGSIRERSIPDEWALLYTGQKGMGTRILMDDFDPRTPPLDPENKLILTTSIMAGTIVSSSAKLAITTKSPQTGTISDGSVGGHIGAELKYAGFDAVSITGRAEALSVLYISPEKVEILMVPELKGLGTFKTDTRIKQLLGDNDLKILANGPAGENQVLYSCICSERYRQLGRGGMGAVMGSKNLKAVAIRGGLDVHVPDIKKCLSLAARVHIDDDVTSPANEIYTDGTPILVDMAQESGLLPTRNFQEGRFEDVEKIHSPAIKEIRKNKKACFSCGIACGNFVEDGMAQVEGPEYETIALCGSNIGNGDRKQLVRFNAVCDDLGLDTISTGSVLAYMMESTEKGIHDFALRFGETAKALSMVCDIAHCTGLGKDAAKGVKALAAQYGGEQFAIHVKGMELPGYDPRGSWAMGLSYATAPRGGCHMSAYPIEAEAWGELDPFTFDGKAQLVADLQNAQFAKFSIGVCDFWGADSDTLARLLEVTYGGEWSGKEVERIGERIFNLQRVFNVMAGFDRDADTLPERFHKEILKAGPPKGVKMPESEFQKALDAYYSIRGWDGQGRPTLEKLEVLGIEEQFIHAYKAFIS